MALMNGSKRECSSERNKSGDYKAIWKNANEDKKHLYLSLYIMGIYFVHGIITEDIVLEMKAAGASLGYFFSFLSAFATMILSFSKSERIDHSIFRNLSSKHVLVGFASFLAQSLAGQAILLLRFNSVQIFKSSKVGFVMFLSYILLDAPISGYGIILACTMSAGLLLFSRADIKTTSSSGSDSPLGFVYMVAGLTLSAYSSVQQQAALQNVRIRGITDFLSFNSRKVKFRGRRLSIDERKRRKNNMLLFSNSLIAFLLFLVCVMNGELSQGYAFFRASSLRISVQQLLALIIGAYGQEMVLTFNQKYGAILSSIILTIRKLLTIVASVLIFPKPFNFSHFFGLTSVMVSALLLQSHLLKLGKAAEQQLTRMDQEGLGHIV